MKDTKNRRRAFRSPPRPLLRASLLSLALCAAGCGKNRFEQELETETSAVKLAREVQRGEYDLVTTEELGKLVDSGAEMLLIDCMPYESSYRKQHIPGAEPFLFPIAAMPEWDPAETGGKTQAQFVELLGTDRAKLIVAYCGFVECTRSHNAAAWAVKLGYTNVKRYAGGIFAWKGAGYETEAAP